MKYYCYDQDGLYATLHELAEFTVPCWIECGEVSAKDSRTLSQNDMINVMYRNIAGIKEDMDYEDVRRHCKLYYGVRGVLAGKESYFTKYKKIFDALKSVTEEGKLALMDVMPVTSEMSKKEAKEYIDLCQRKWAEQGVVL